MDSYPKPMEKQEIVLRNSRRRLIVSAIVSGLAAVFCILSAFIYWQNKDGQWLVILVAVAPLAGCVYCIKEWRDHKIEMVISTEGIRLRREGFYSWSSIEKISTDVDEGDVKLILYVRDRAPIHFGITSLEIDDEELIDLILAYGQPAGLFYTKH
jgi:hypothetical protein